MEYITTTQLIIGIIGIGLISFVFSIFGRGGGEFKLPLLLSIITLPFEELKALSVFLILLQGIAMMFVYGKKHKLVDWPVAIILAVAVGCSSFLGGYYSHWIPPMYIKGLFAAVLLISALKMMFQTTKQAQKAKIGVWHRKMKGLNGDEYDVNILYLIPPVMGIGFIAGMLGVSGCGLIIPLCVVLGGMPLRMAIGSNTLLLISSSGSSFAGHLIKTPFYWDLGIILGVSAITGAYLGSKQHISLSEKSIKVGFIIILLVAAVWMIIKMFK